WVPRFAPPPVSVAPAKAGAQYPQELRLPTIGRFPAPPQSRGYWVPDHVRDDADYAARDFNLHRRPDGGQGTGPIALPAVSPWAPAYAGATGENVRPACPRGRPW